MAVPATELEKLIAALHAAPKAVETADPKDPNKKVITYTPHADTQYDGLLPGVLKELGLEGKAELDKAESAKLMRAITDKLDAEAGPEGSLGVRGSFAAAFQRAMGKDGNKSTLKPGELEAELKGKDFRDQMHLAQIGLIGRDAQMQQPVWTLDKIMQLIKALISGEPKQLQDMLAGAARPEQPLNFTPDADKVNLDHPAMADLAAMSDEMVERVFWAANKPGVPFDENMVGAERGYSTKGPISQAAFEALDPADPQYAFFKDQPRLEVVMDQVLADLEREGKLGAYMDKHGIAPEMMDELKSSLRSGVLTGAQRGKAPQEYTGHDGRNFFVVFNSKDAAKETAARLFGAALDDPQFNLSPIDGPRIAGYMSDTYYGRSLGDTSTYADSFKGIDKLSGDFAWRMARAAGFVDPDGLHVHAGKRTDYSELYHKGTADLNLDGFAPETASFIKDMHKTAQENLEQVLGYIQPSTDLNREIPKGTLPDHLKQFEGKRAINLLEDLTGGAIADKYRADPVMRERLGIAGDAILTRDRFAQVQPPSEDMFDIRKTYAGLKMDANGQITIPGGKAIKLSEPEGGIPVYAIHGKGLTADGQGVVNYDVIDRFDLKNLKKAMGDQEFSLTFLAERDGKHAAGWHIKTADGRNMYLGLGAEGGIDEASLDPAIKNDRVKDPVPGAPKGPGVVYETSMQQRPWEADGMRVGMSP